MSGNREFVCLEKLSERVNYVPHAELTAEDYEDMLAAKVPHKDILECRVPGCTKKLAKAESGASSILLPLFISKTGSMKCLARTVDTPE